MLGQLIFLKITAVSFVLLVWCATPHRTIIFLIIKITASHLNLGFITAISTPPADFMIWCVYMVPLGVWCLWTSFWGVLLLVYNVHQAHGGISGLNILLGTYISNDFVSVNSTAAAGWNRQQKNSAVAWKVVYWDSGIFRFLASCMWGAGGQISIRLLLVACVFGLFNQDTSEMQKRTESLLCLDSLPCVRFLLQQK